MVIRSKLETKGNPYADDLDSLRAANEIVAEAGKRVLSRIAPSALTEMRAYPPPAKLPFAFATEKSRRYYFVLVKQGKVPTANGHYRRTGGLANSMFFDGKAESGRYVFTAGSRSKIAKWVVGTFDMRRNYQVQGHKNTGWFPLAKTVNYWLQETNSDMRKEVASAYVEYKSRRRNR